MNDSSSTPAFTVAKDNHAALYPHLADLELAIRDLLLSGTYILGPQVSCFEQEFGDYLGSTDVVGLNSGTDALILSLAALGIGPGDEVITVANTFHSTVLAIARVGATPVLVDCLPETYLMDLEQLASAVTARTRAVIVVHLFGRSVDMAVLTQIAEDAGLLVIEDCAQAAGAESHARKVGTWGAVGCFSFQPAKNLPAAGDAGAIATSDPAIADQIRVLRNLGQSTSNTHVAAGYNSRLDSIQALILRSKLPHLDTWNGQRAGAAREYDRRLQGAGLPASHPWRPKEHVFHLYQVTTAHRDTVLQTLRSRGIEAVVRYPVPIHQQPVFANHFGGSSFPVAEQQARSTVCLPIRPDLTEADIDYVATTVITALTASAADR